MTERVEVTWVDSESDSAWLPLARALIEAEHQPTHRTCGYLLADTDEYLLLALNMRDEAEGQRALVADTMRIPRSVVSSVTRLREVKQ